MTPSTDAGEVIVRPDLPIIDAHHHLLASPTERYLFDEYLADVGSGHRVIGSVYVEIGSMLRASGPGALRPLGEVEFANGIAAMSASGHYGDVQIAAGIVGRAHLDDGARVAELLDRCLAAAPERFRGVRQVAVRHKPMLCAGTEGLLGSPTFRRGFAELAPRGLSFEGAVFHHQMPEVSALAEAFPETTIILNHMATAVVADWDGRSRQDLFDEWRANLMDVAQSPNVICKVGGLGMPSWGFGFDASADGATARELAHEWRPYVETAIEAFGVNRCMMESNFPMDSASAQYHQVWNALKLSVDGASEDELNALFHQTAARTYRLELPVSALHAPSG